MSSGGVRIPYYQNIDQASVPCQYFHVNAEYQVDRPVAADGPLLDKACDPLFSQLHGFADANNIIGEATSHGTFLAGLMEVWSRRAYTFSMADKEALRRAIITTALYLEELFQEGGTTGEFAHSEMGRGGVQTDLGPWQSQLALYGMSAFADKGAFVDKGLARLACQDSMAGADWLAEKRYFDDATAQSIIYAHLARCTRARTLPLALPNAKRTIGKRPLMAPKRSCPPLVDLGELALNTAMPAASSLGLKGSMRCCKPFPKSCKGTPTIRTMAMRRAQDHRRYPRQPSDTRASLRRCVTTGCALCGQRLFRAAASRGGDASWPLINWTQMDQMPLANRPTTLPYLNLYNVGHFAVSASDAVYLAMMTGRSDLEPVASGDLNWVLGLNPGIPAVKIVNGDPDGRPWQAASFIYNQGPAFARTFEGFRTEATAAKGWQGVLGGWPGLTPPRDLVGRSAQQWLYEHCQRPCLVGQPMGLLEQWRAWLVEWRNFYPLRWRFRQGSAAAGGLACRCANATR